MTRQLAHGEHGRVSGSAIGAPQVGQVTCYDSVLPGGENGYRVGVTIC